MFLRPVNGYKQALPEGFERIGLWPTDLFSQIAPPQSPEDLKNKK